ncbi:MAG: NAD-binding protein [Gemmatimonadetes bacterium]|nr:NAD-binding protein [Gemmatimonadota bacterium]
MSSSGTLGQIRKLNLPWRVVAVAWAAATTLLGIWGYVTYSDEHGHPITGLTAVYHTLQLFILHAPHFEGHIPWPLEISRWSAALWSAANLVAVSAWYRSRLGHARVQRMTGHVIVCGLGRKGLECVAFERKQPLGLRREVVVIDKAPSRESTIMVEALGAEVLTGDATNADALRNAGVDGAAAVFALCDNDDTNCEVVTQVASLVMAGPARHQPLLCSVHVSDVELREKLQAIARDSLDGARLSVRFFDLFDVEARRLLLTDLPIDHGGIPVGDTRRVHLVIVGFGRMGRAVALRAVRLGHFANTVRDDSLRMKISVVDTAANLKVKLLMYHHPQFASICELDVHEAQVESVGMKAQFEHWCHDPGTITSIAVCLDDEARATATAINLLDALTHSGSRLGLRLARRTGLAHVMDLARKRGVAASVVPFGMIADGCCHTAFAEDERERLAQEVHRDFVGKQWGTRDHRDPSMKSWRDLREVLRASNRQQADHIEIKLRAIGCEIAAESDLRPAVTAFDAKSGALSELELLAQMEHNRWWAERLLDGWTYAPEKDVAKLRNPSLVPWSALGEDVREWDRNAVRAIPTILAASRMKVCRTAITVAPHAPPTTSVP